MAVGKPQSEFEKLAKNRGTWRTLVDRKSVVQGKSVDLGGRRIIKKKKKEEKEKEKEKNSTRQRNLRIT